MSKYLVGSLCLAMIALLLSGMFWLQEVVNQGNQAYQQGFIQARDDILAHHPADLRAAATVVLEQSTPCLSEKRFQAIAQFSNSDLREVRTHIPRLTPQARTDTHACYRQQLVAYRVLSTPSDIEKLLAAAR